MWFQVSRLSFAKGSVKGREGWVSKVSQSHFGLNFSTFFSKESPWPLKKLIVSFLNTKDNWFSCCSFLSWHFNWRFAQQQHCHVDSKRENYKDYELSFGRWVVGTLCALRFTTVAASWCLKGEVRQFFFYWPKVFIGPKLREVSKGNFHWKDLKWVKNQAKGSKIHKIRTKQPI